MKRATLTLLGILALGAGLGLALSAEAAETNRQPTSGPRIAAPQWAPIS